MHCHVWVDARSCQPGSWPPRPVSYEIRIEARVPGSDLAVSAD
jgi:hypothetical protein